MPFSTTSEAVSQNDASNIDSRFRLIIVAASRAKQLLNGSHPRIEVNPLRKRNTSIALEEVRRGLVPFRIRNDDNNHLAEKM